MPETPVRVDFLFDREEMKKWLRLLEGRRRVAGREQLKESIREEIKIKIHSSLWDV